MVWYVDQISWPHVFLLVLFFALAWLWIFPRDCWHPPGREQKTNGKQLPFLCSFFLYLRVLRTWKAEISNGKLTVSAPKHFFIFSPFLRSFWEIWSGQWLSLYGATDDLRGYHFWNTFFFFLKQINSLIVWWVQLAQGRVRWVPEFGQECVA